MTEEPTTEYSPYAVCYDISKTSERPEHSNWVIPAGTTILVDFDMPVKRALQEGYNLARYKIDLEMKKATR